MAVHGKNAFGPFIGHGLEIPIDPTALWEYKGGQEDIRKISGKMHRKPPTEKYIRFTYRIYLTLFMAHVFTT